MPFSTRVQIALTRLTALLALLWEALAPPLLPVLAIAAAYCALALFGLWQAVGDPWRLAALLASLAAMAVLLVRGLRTVRLPGAAALARRLEQDARLPGRPLEILRDRPAGPVQENTARLWQTQRARALARLAHMRPRPPRAALARADRYGVRVAAMLALFAGFVLAGPHSARRLDDAFAPRLLGRGHSPAQLQAWIAAPEYTGAPPRFIKDDAAPPKLEALQGAQFHLLVRGTRTRPLLYQFAGGRRTRLKLRKTGPGAYDLATAINGNTRLVLRRPLDRRWDIQARPDAPPKIIFTAVPEGNDADALHFAYVARDDVGIAAVELRIAVAGDPQKHERKALDLPVLKARTVKDAPVLDLTRHRWAGLAVRLALIARDGAGQEGSSRPVFMTLPEKLFVNPLARAIAEQRALLVRNDAAYAPMPKRKPLYAEDVRARPRFAEDDPARRLERAPYPVRRAAKMMRASLRAPELYFDDRVVYAGLRAAAGEVRLARRRADLKDLDGALWALAVRVEGGSLADARAALKAAERALRRALARHAPADEAARLMHNYERAVKRYMQALAEEALRTGKMAKAGGDGAAMNASQLQEMLDALKALAETGNTGDARKLLQALSSLLQNLRMQLAAGAGAGHDPASEAMRKALEKLGDLTARQREILDQIFRRQAGSQGPASGQSPESGGALAGQQKKLGQRLDDLAKDQNAQGRTGVGKALDEGAKAMGRAAGALRRGGADDDALAAGKEALSALRKGDEKLAQGLFAQSHKQGRDPFGRRNGDGVLDGSGVRVPDIIDAQRARKILKTLRNRAAEQGRPKPERDYLDRLLEQF